VSNCAELYDPTTSLARQAALVALRNYGSAAGFVEDADFTKLREVSITVGLPQRFARRVRTQALNVTLKIDTFVKETSAP
jgi:hypothetical protein